MTWTILMFLAFVGFAAYIVWDTFRFERRLNGRGR
jgi:hypothetical protein